MRGTGPRFQSVSLSVISYWAFLSVELNRHATLGHRYSTARVSKRLPHRSAACLRARYCTDLACVDLKNFKHLQRVRYLAERRRDLHALHVWSNLHQHLLRDLHALFQTGDSVGRLPHPFEHRIVLRGVWNFVVQKLGVAVTGQRPDSRDDRDAAMFYTLEEVFELPDVEDRLRDGEFGAGLDLPLEAPDFIIQVNRARVDAHADDEFRRLADRIAAGIEAVVEVVDQVRQTDRIDIEDGRGVRVRPHLRRIAGDDQKVSQSERRRPEQVGEHPEQVSIAATVMRDGLDADLLFDDQRDGQRAHARLGARAVGHVDRVDAGLFQTAHAFDHLRGVAAFWRNDLDAGDKLAVGDLIRKPRTFGEGRWFHLRALFGDQDPAAGAAARARRARGVHNLLDVLRRRAAAAADELHSRVDQPLGVFGHVLRGGQIDLTPADVARESGVGLRRKPPRGVRPHPFNRFKDDLRADRAVQSDHVALVRLEPLVEPLGEDFGRRAERGRPLLVDGHLSEDDVVA